MLLSRFLRVPVAMMAFYLLSAFSATASAAPPSVNPRFDALANAPFVENRPTKASQATLADELLFQRATQTYLWAMPLINTLGMKVGARRPPSAQAITCYQSGSAGLTQRPLSPRRTPMSSMR
jgi:hypothetical protein